MVNFSAVMHSILVATLLAGAVILDALHSAVKSLGTFILSSGFTGTAILVIIVVLATSLSRVLKRRMEPDVEEPPTPVWTATLRSSGMRDIEASLDTAWIVNSIARSSLLQRQHDLERQLPVIRDDFPLRQKGAAAMVAGLMRNLPAPKGSSGTREVIPEKV